MAASFPLVVVTRPLQDGERSRRSLFSGQPFNRFRDIPLGGAALLLRNRAPYFVVGYAWYLVALGPVIGLVQAGMQGRADRFTYLPSVGILIAVVWGVSTLLERRPALGPVALSALALIALANGVATRHYLRLWENDDLLLQHTLSVTQRNWFIHANYGDSLFLRGKIDDAAMQYEKALAIEPRTPVAQGRLASIKLQRGELDQAFDHVAWALVGEPNLKDANRTLTRLLQLRGIQPEAAALMAAQIRDGMSRAGRDMTRNGGTSYRQSLGSTLWRQHGSMVARCRTEIGPSPAFALFLTISTNGDVAEAVASPPSALGQCLAAGLTGSRLLAPPFAPFHALVTMQLGA